MIYVTVHLFYLLFNKVIQLFQGNQDFIEVSLIGPTAGRYIH